MTNNFLNPKPVMTEKEREELNKVSNSPYFDLYDKSTESELYTSVKAKRKQSELPKLKWNPEKVDTYGELAINKYKTSSPLALSINPLTAMDDPIESGAGALDNNVSDVSFQQLSTRQMLRRDAEKAGGKLKKGVAQSLSTGVGILDYGAQQFGKAGVLSTTGIARLKYDFDELVRTISPAIPDIKEFAKGDFSKNPLEKVEPFDFNAVAEKTEDIQKTAEYFFGTKIAFSDYLDIRGMTEKRESMLKEMPLAQQEALKGTGLATLSIDVITSILSGQGALSAPKAIIKKAGPLSAIGKSMIALEKNLKGLKRPTQKAGVLMGAAAFLYHQQTGKWMFEGDAGATEGAAVLMLSPALAGLGKVSKGVWNLSGKGREKIQAMYQSEDFQKGVSDYFTEVGNQFANKADEIATKVGAKTNLLPGGDEFNSGRVFDGELPAKQVEDEGAATIDLLMNASDTHVRESGGFYNNAVKSGIIDEGMPLSTAIQRQARLAFSPEKKADIIAGEIAGDVGIKFNKDMSFKDLLLGNFFKPANRILGDGLEGTRVYGKVSNFNNALDLARSRVANVSEFNQYLFAKSRYFKVKGKDVDTNIKTTQGGKTVVSSLTEKQLKEAYEKLEPKYGRVAEGIYEQYDNLLQYEKSLGIRTAEDLDNFAKNPSWMPDKTMDTGEIFKDSISKLSINTPKKYLGKGFEVLDNNSIMNAYSDMSYRFEVANRLDKLNRARDSGMALVKPLPEGTNPDKGFIGFKLYENGEQVGYQGKDFFVKSVLQDDKLSTNIYMRVATIPTKLIKMKTTGIGAPIFNLVAPYFEGTAALIKNRLNGNSMNDYVTTMLAGSSNKASDKFVSALGKLPGVDMTKAIEESKGGDFFQTPAMKKSFIEMANFLGAGFTKSSRSRLELEATLGDEYTRYSIKQAKFERGKDLRMTVTNATKYLSQQIEKGKDSLMKVRDAVDIGNSIELFTTRLPLFAADLKKQGITPKIFKELSESSKSTVELIGKLEDMGMNPKKSANIARNFYDYAIAKKTVDESGRFLMYLSDIVARGPASVKKAIEDNPNLFVKGMGVATVATHAIYEFNTNTPEKKEAYENAPDYYKNSSYLFMGVDEATGQGEFVKIAKNIPMLNFASGIYNETRNSLEGEGFDASKAFTSMVEDTTGVFSLEKPFNFDIIPESMNRYAEFKTGFNLKLDYKKFTRTKREEEIPTEDYDKRTSNFAISLSRLMAVTGGGEVVQEADAMRIRGGYQVSPRKIDMIMDTFDSGLIRGKLDGLINKYNNDGRVDKYEAGLVLNEFIKKASVTKFDEEQYNNVNKAAAEEQAITHSIDSQIMNADSNELAVDRAIRLGAQYPRKETTIMNKLKERVKLNNLKEQGGDMQMYFLSKNDNAVIARALLSKSEDYEDSGKWVVGEISKMVDLGLISEKKGINILSTVPGILSENN